MKIRNLGNINFCSHVCCFTLQLYGSKNGSQYKYRKFVGSAISYNAYCWGFIYAGQELW